MLEAAPPRRNGAAATTSSPTFSDAIRRHLSLYSAYVSLLTSNMPMRFPPECSLVLVGPTLTDPV